MNRQAADRALELVKLGVLVVDKLGQIWRMGWNRTPEDYRLYPKPRRAESAGPKGYLRLAMLVGGKIKHTPAHRLVWEAANGPIAPGLEINHVDGDKRNNQLANLEAVSASRNSLHAVKVLLRPPAWSVSAKEGRTINGHSLRAEETIGRVVEDLRAGESTTVVAKRYDLDVAYVHGLRYRRLGKVPKLLPQRRAQIEQMLLQGATVLQIVKAVKTSPYAVINIRREMEHAGS